jgi:spore germination cell wall hydrolase CwlJ-like protein|tara:strand:+ start:1044 stop:1538 length:495 start_codon:yes stop_codon:yes gene_type:complete
MMKTILASLAIVATSASIAKATECGKEDEIHALAMNMYHEARGQGSEAMQLVGEVTLNRANNKNFPNTICQVVYQARFDKRGNPRRHKCQFSWFCDGLSDKPYNAKSWKLAEVIATGLVNKTISLIGIQATHYHATSVKPYWSKKYTRLGRHGDHVFYQMGKRL